MPITDLTLKSALQAFYKSKISLPPLLGLPEQKIADTYVNLVLVKDNVIEREEKKLTHQDDVSAQKKDQFNYLVAKTIPSLESIYQEANQEPVNLTNLFDSKNEPKRLLILGQAGVGKTTLSHFFAYQWALGTLWPDQFDYVLWIPLKNLMHKKYQKAENLVIDIIREECLTKPISKAAEKELEHLFDLDLLASSEKVQKDHKNVVFILDGCDEVAATLTSNNSIPRQFIEAVKQLSCNLLMTSRAYQVQQLKDLINFNAVYFNIGFTDANVRKYIKRYFGTDSSGAERLLTHLSTKPAFKQLARIPLQVRLLCFLSQRSTFNLQVANLASIYDHLTMTFIQQTAIKKGQSIANLTKIQLYHRYQDTLSCIKWLAWMSLRAGAILISAELKQHYAQIYPEVDFSHVLGEIGFLRGLSEEEKPEIEKTHYFVHKTFQEFFAAWYLWDQLAQEQVTSNQNISPIALDPINWLRIYKYSDTAKMIWPFLTGLCYLKYKENIQKSQEKIAALASLIMEPRNLIAEKQWQIILACLEEVNFDDCPEVMLKLAEPVKVAVLNGLAIPADVAKPNTRMLIAIANLLSEYPNAQKYFIKDLHCLWQSWLKHWPKLPMDVQLALAKGFYALVKAQPAIFQTVEEYSKQILLELMTLLSSNSDLSRQGKIAALILEINQVHASIRKQLFSIIIQKLHKPKFCPHHYYDELMETVVVHELDSAKEILKVIDKNNGTKFHDAFKLLTAIIKEHESLIDTTLEITQKILASIKGKRISNSYDSLANLINTVIKTQNIQHAVIVLDIIQNYPNAWLIESTLRLIMGAHPSLVTKIQQIIPSIQLPFDQKLPVYKAITAVSPEFAQSVLEQMLKEIYDNHSQNLKDIYTIIQTAIRTDHTLTSKIFDLIAPDSEVMADILLDEKRLRLLQLMVEVYPNRGKEALSIIARYVNEYDDIDLYKKILGSFGAMLTANTQLAASIFNIIKPWLANTEIMKVCAYDLDYDDKYNHQSVLGVFNLVIGCNATLAKEALNILEKLLSNITDTNSEFLEEENFSTSSDEEYDSPNDDKALISNYRASICIMSTIAKSSPNLANQIFKIANPLLKLPAYKPNVYSLMAVLLEVNSKLAQDILSSLKLESTPSEVAIKMLTVMANKHPDLSGEILKLILPCVIPKKANDYLAWQAWIALKEILKANATLAKGIFKAILPILEQEKENKNLLEVCALIIQAEPTFANQIINAVFELFHEYSRSGSGIRDDALRFFSKIAKADEKCAAMIFNKLIENWRQEKRYLSSESWPDKITKLIKFEPRLIKDLINIYLQSLDLTSSLIVEIIRENKFSLTILVPKVIVTANTEIYEITFDKKAKEHLKPLIAAFHERSLLPYLDSTEADSYLKVKYCLNYELTPANKVWKSLLALNLGKFTKLIHKELKFTSPFLLKDESSYHNIVFTLLRQQKLACSDVNYDVIPDTNNSYAANRADIFIIPKIDIKDTGIIIEFKHEKEVKDQQKLETTALKEALGQIDEKNYHEALTRGGEAKHIKKIIEVGMAFNKYNVCTFFRTRNLSDKSISAHEGPFYQGDLTKLNVNKQPANNNKASKITKKQKL